MSVVAFSHDIEGGNPRCSDTDTVSVVRITKRILLFPAATFQSCHMFKSSPAVRTDEACPLCHSYSHNMSSSCLQDLTGTVRKTEKYYFANGGLPMSGKESGRKGPQSNW